MRVRDSKGKVVIMEAFSPYTLEKAMDDQRVISIYYDSPHDTIDKGWRRIEPYVYGVNKHGNTVLRAWQIGGASDTPKGKLNDPLTKMPGWRMFRIDGIKNTNIGGGDTIEKARPKYNPDDKDMNKIFKAIQFGSDGSIETLTNPTFTSSKRDDLPKDEEIPRKDKEPVITPKTEPRIEPSRPVNIRPEPQQKDDDIEDITKDPRLSNKPKWIQNLLNVFNKSIKKRR